jgi:hypothetical protein
VNADEFLERHGLAVNPFAAEDAVQDSVLGRATEAWRHPDFAKILGDPAHPAPTVVFGERGSGKTALRLQMERALAAWNRDHSGERVLVMAHDDFDGMLHAIARHDGLREPAQALEGLRLADHVDAALHRVIPALVDQALDAPGADLLRGGNLRRTLRKAPVAVRRDLLLLQVAYDHPSAAVRRTRRLRSAMRLGGSSGAALAGIWSLLLLGIAAMAGLLGAGRPPQWSFVVPAGLLAVAGLTSGWAYLVRSARVALVARRLGRAIRVLQRDGGDWRRSLHLLPIESLEAALPQDRGEDMRYAMLDRLVRVLAAAGYGSAALLVDRVDEPACVAGDPARMRSLVWPLMSSRFLQHPGIAVKLLLPRELGDLAAREDDAFHRGARLDKQNLIDRLQWTGAMLAELCDARLAAATRTGSRAPRIEDLFDPSVGRARLAEALERMGTPRRACRMVYAAIQEHLSHANADEHRVSAAALEWVRRRAMESTAPNG